MYFFNSTKNGVFLIKGGDTPVTVEVCVCGFTGSLTDSVRLVSVPLPRQMFFLDKTEGPPPSETAPNTNGVPTPGPVPVGLESTSRGRWCGTKEEGRRSG